MSETLEKRTGIGLPVTVCVLLLLLAAYIGGYFALSTKYDDNVDGSPVVCRVFQSRTTCEAYYPFGWIEAKIDNSTVEHVRPPDAHENTDQNWWSLWMHHGGIKVSTFKP